MRGWNKIDALEILTILIMWSGLAAFVYYILDGYFFR